MTKILVNKNKALWLPYKIICMYFVILFLLSIVGPVRYVYDGFYVFIEGLYLLFFLLVTWLGMAKASTYWPKYHVSNRNELKLLRVLKFSVLVIFPIKILLVISSIYINGMPSIDSVFVMLANVYTNMHSSSGEINIFRQIDTFTTFIFYFSTFIGIYWRKKLPKVYFVLILFSMILDIVYNMFFIGTQRSLITIVVLLITLLGTGSINSKKIIDKRKIRKIVLIVVISLVIIMNILSARRNLWSSGNYNIYQIKDFDYSHWLLIWCRTDQLKYSVCSVISYLTQGFYCFSLALQVPFEWTFMLGSVRGINSVINQIIPIIPMMENYTYPMRAGEIFARNGLAYWYTIFPWLASDWTYLGALLYMEVVGYLFMRVWKQVIEFKNPIAFMMLVLLVIQYLFSIANNQLFITRGEAIGTVILLIVYMLSNKKYNYDTVENV